MWEQGQWIHFFTRPCSCSDAVSIIISGGMVVHLQEFARACLKIFTSVNKRIKGFTVGAYIIVEGWRLFEWCAYSIGQE